MSSNCKTSCIIRFFHAKQKLSLQYSFGYVHASGQGSWEQATIKEKHPLCWLIYCCFLNIIKSGLLNSPKKKILPLHYLSSKFRLKVVSCLEVINLHSSTSSLLLQFCFCLISNKVPMRRGLLRGQAEPASADVCGEGSSCSAGHSTAPATSGSRKRLMGFSRLSVPLLLPSPQLPSCKWSFQSEGEA